MTTRSETGPERVSIKLAAPAHEMAQEEVLKQLAFLSPRIRGGRFDAGGEVLEFDAPADEAEGLAEAAHELARKIQRGLRSLQRKVVFRSAAADRPALPGPVPTPGAHPVGVGLVALEGLSLALFEYFDRAFAAMGEAWGPSPLRTPTLIATDVLAKCDYFRSFPHNVTFATHLSEDPAQRESFLARHRDALRAGRERAGPDGDARGLPVAGRLLPRLPPGAGTATSSPPARPTRSAASASATNRRNMRRPAAPVGLHDARGRLSGRPGGAARGTREGRRGDGAFSGRARSGRRDPHRQRSVLHRPGRRSPRSYFQLSSDAKYEVALSLPDGARLAVGSLNHHSDFFGRVFDISLADGGAAHSACIAFGLERWVYAFLAQHGDDPARWPAVVRDGLGAQVPPRPSPTAP